ncbi:MAG: hypothetical protein RL318_2134 [Fibrobacterota bacterium]|jgi:prepilin-type N-terminal cleavage/methylation domain-containing protein
MKSKLGYTLIEVLVAVILLAIVLPGLAVYVIGARKGQAGAARLEQGATASQRVLDSLALFPSRVVNINDSARITIDGQVYTVRWTVTPSSTGRRVALVSRWSVGKTQHSTSSWGILP